jgi:hypothetical protein
VSQAENEEYARLREFARLMVAQMPEPFAIDMLLMLYQMCMAHVLPLDELLDVFGPAGFAFVSAAVYEAPRENPEPRYKVAPAWPQTFVVTQIGHIDEDGIMRPAQDEIEGGTSYLFQEFFRRRRSGD